MKLKCRETREESAVPEAKVSKKRAKSLERVLERQIGSQRLRLSFSLLVAKGINTRCDE